MGSNSVPPIVALSHPAYKRVALPPSPGWICWSWRPFWIAWRPRFSCRNVTQRLLYICKKVALPPLLEWTSGAGQLSGEPGDQGLFAEMLPRDCYIFARRLPCNHCQNGLLELDNFLAWIPRFSCRNVSQRLLNICKKVDWLPVPGWTSGAGNLS